MLRWSLALVVCGCGEDTLYPQEPPPAYGATPEWWVCGEFGLGPESAFQVRNDTDGPVELWSIPYGCAGTVVTVVEAGATHDQDGGDGSAWALRDPVVGIVFDNWLYTGGEPALVAAE